MRIPINTKQELCDCMYSCDSRHLDDSSTKTDIVDCFADIAEYLINRCLITIDNEQYRARAVEFYYFNPQHLDFFACFLTRYDLCITGNKSPYGITFEFGRNFYGYYIDHLIKYSYFGYVVITDLECDTPLKELLKNNESLSISLQDSALPPSNIVRKIRTCDFIHFDDVYEYVNRVRKRVNVAIYCREDIAQALLHFRKQRYRFEAYKKDY